MGASIKKIFWAVLIMFNFTEVNDNTVRQTTIVASSVLALMVLSFFVYIYFVAIILHVFFTRPHVRENARYILFIHLVINDTVGVTVLILLFSLGLYFVYTAVPLCYVLCLFPACLYVVTPYNLAIMSLERFVAICCPLRYAEICTVQRSLLTIGILWLLGLTPHFIDFIAMCYSMPKNFFSINLICNWAVFEMNKVQVIIRNYWNVFSTLPLVGLTILYTYIRIMVVARRSGSGRSSAFKAEKTVLLHALQLGLCMMGFVSSTTDEYVRGYFFFLPITNYFFFLCIPRFISPLIYGVRDEVFQKQMRKMNFLA